MSISQGLTHSLAVASNVPPGRTAQAIQRTANILVWMAKTPWIVLTELRGSPRGFEDGGPSPTGAALWAELWTRGVWLKSFFPAAVEGTEEPGRLSRDGD